MKLRVTFKDPDQLWEAFESKKREITKDLMENVGIGRAAAEVEAAERMRQFDSFMKYFKWGEYLTVEMDSDLGTITVVADND